MFALSPIFQRAYHITKRAKSLIFLNESSSGVHQKELRFTNLAHFRRTHIWSGEQKTDVNLMFFRSVPLSFVKLF